MELGWSRNGGAMELGWRLNGGGWSLNGGKLHLCMPCTDAYENYPFYHIFYGRLWSSSPLEVSYVFYAKFWPVFLPKYVGDIHTPTMP